MGKSKQGYAVAGEGQGGANTALPRGRPRKPTTDEKILSAARDVLKESGFDAMSFEAVAQRAGVTRPTIYRRWRSKAHLVNELVMRGPGLPSSFVCTDIGTGIERWLRSMHARCVQPEMKAAIAGLISTYQMSPQLRAELEMPIEVRARQIFRQTIQDAQGNGQVRSIINPDTLFDVIIGSILYRALGSSFQPSPNFIDEICDIVLRGIQSPGSAIRKVDEATDAG